MTWDAFGRLSAATLADGKASYKFGPSQERAIAAEPHAVTHYISSSFEVQDGLGVIYARLGQSRVARLVSTDLAAKIYTDVAPLDAPDGKITAGDAWVANASANGVLPSMSTSPADRLLLSSARRILYETVAQSTWFGHDQLGSLTVETDDHGAVIGRRAYYPFGAERDSTGDADRYGFTNQEVDGTGMLHFSHRQLDPTLGRWASSDPEFAAASEDNAEALGEATSGYAYVANNPANFLDSTGLAIEEVNDHGATVPQDVRELASQLAAMAPARGFPADIDTVFSAATASYEDGPGVRIIGTNMQRRQLSRAQEALVAEAEGRAGAEKIRFTFANHYRHAELSVYAGARNAAQGSAVTEVHMTTYGHGGMKEMCGGCRDHRPAPEFEVRIHDSRIAQRAAAPVERKVAAGGEHKGGGGPKRGGGGPKRGGGGGSKRGGGGSVRGGKGKA